MTRSLSLVVALLLGLSGCSTVTPQRSSRDRAPERYRDARSFPSSAKRSEGGQERYLLCHNGRASTYPTAAVRAHLDHGDRFGECGRRGRRDAARRGDGRGRDGDRDRDHDRDGDD